MMHIQVLTLNHYVGAIVMRSKSLKQMLSDFG